MEDQRNNNENTLEFNRMEFAWKIYLNTQEMIKLADQKVYVSAAVSLLIVTAFFTSDIGKTAITLGCIGKILALAFLGSTAYFIYYALKSLIPRPASHTKDDVPKLIFF